MSKLAKKFANKSSRNSVSKSVNKSSRKSSKVLEKEYSRQSSKQLSKQSKSSRKNSEQVLIKGKLIGNKKGFAFVEQEDKNLEDIFIPAPFVFDAIHGDEVLVSITKQSSDKRSEGRIEKVLSHHIKTIVGTIQVFKNFAFVVPDNKKISKDVFVKKYDIKNAIDGDKVVVKINKYEGRNLEGEVVEVLGKANSNPLTDVLSIVRSYELIEEFPKLVEEKAKEVSELDVQKQLSKRKDLRSLLTFTIDGDDSKDFDDAVSLTIEDDAFVLGVHIADVGEFVRRKSILDEEAFNRATSVYFPNLVLPMLPEAISNGCCSLVEGEDRLTLSCIMKIDQNGKVISHEICESVINSTNRMTYKKVTKILEGDKELCNQYAHLVQTLKNMEKLCLILEANRKNNGSLDFDVPEPKIVVDPVNMEVISLEKRPRTISERIIESFMVLANETVAEHFQKLKIPFVYRIHEKPDADKIRGFNEFVKNLNMSLTEENVSPKDISNFLSNLENHPMKDVVNKVLLRAMQKAKYSPDCLGHFGLASKFYCHFTSPIRRYPDLTIHRIIKDYLHNKLDENALKTLKKFVVESSNQSSEKEVSAQQAERDVDDYYKARYMKDKIGQEFEGIVSGVMPYGIFVELENTCEGFSPIETLKGGNYIYNEKLLKLSNGIYSYRLGDKVKVKIVSVNLSERRINFQIL